MWSLQLVVTVDVTCKHRASANSGSKSITPRNSQPLPAPHASEGEEQLKHLSEWAVKEHLDFVKKEKQVCCRYCSVPSVQYGRRERGKWFAVWCG